MARSTRESILTAAAELMRHRGYGAVAMKDIAAASGAPIGSLYHHFRDGKVQIAREALLNAGAAYALLIPSVVDEYTDLGAALEGVFAQAAEDMAATGYANMCPIASVAAEVAGTVEELRDVTAGVFTGWLDGGTAYFTARGLAPTQAREVTVALVAALEGAFVLARTLRDGEPLLAAGRVLGPQFRGVELIPASADVSGRSRSKL
ncbi:TetR/AcrR family transcriptional regulator [Mycolicibacterium sp. S2-37]|uniref:TetR/AcrR family transcriptional regulator n=1 Tax=Mycolicibacterium sp. S2-37 TaxID=2810297 RepID=UPI001A93C500|nr:TetR/AcrR family transcriptional regulator [Mycolicibacterium sp. S2-37]MBO0676641.1 TetR/AcrR family transcriptional regulator [Mycolicibacterium sp. S2-37]